MPDKFHPMTTRSCRVCGGIYIGKSRSVKCGDACRRIDANRRRAANRLDPDNRAHVREVGAKRRATAEGRAVALAQRERHREYRRAYGMAYKQRPAAMLSARLRQARRTAQRKAAATHRVTARDIAKILTRPCAYCGAKANEIEHVIPLSRGGRHAIGNLTASCSRCNASKRDRLVVEWKRWLGGRHHAAA